MRIHESKAPSKLVITSLLLAVLGMAGCGGDCEELLYEVGDLTCEIAECTDDREWQENCDLIQETTPEALLECPDAPDEVIDTLEQARDLLLVEYARVCV